MKINKLEDNILTSKLRLLHSCLSGNNFEEADKYLNQVENIIFNMPNPESVLDISSVKNLYTSLKDMARKYGPFDKPYTEKLNELRSTLLESEK